MNKKEEKFVVDRLQRLMSLDSTHRYKILIGDKPENFWLNKEVRKTINEFDQLIQDTKEDCAKIVERNIMGFGSVEIDGLLGSIAQEIRNSK